MEPLPPDHLYKERYLEEEKIGQGGFGKVFLVKEKDGEKCYAAKCIKVRESISKKIILISSVKARGRKEKERGRREVAMLKNLDSDFVIRLVDAYEGRSEVILVTEYLAGGELFERVVDEDFDLTESHCVLFVRQICQGVGRQAQYTLLAKTRCYRLQISPRWSTCTTATLSTWTSSRRT